MVHLSPFQFEKPGLQIVLSGCRTISFSECLSGCLLAEHDTCTLCRTRWLDIPEGVTIAFNAVVDVKGGMGNSQTVYLDA
jgi:hypothetical protein